MKEQERGAGVGAFLGCYLTRRSSFASEPCWPTVSRVRNGWTRNEQRAHVSDPSRLFLCSERTGVSVPRGNVTALTDAIPPPLYAHAEESRTIARNWLRLRPEDAVFNLRPTAKSTGAQS